MPGYERAGPASVYGFREKSLPLSTRDTKGVAAILRLLGTFAFVAQP